MKGLLGKKIGMTQIFSAEGNFVPVTVVHAENIVIQKKYLEKDGYLALQLGYESLAEKKFNKAMGGHFRKIGSYFRTLKELRLNEDVDLNEGDSMGADIFNVGEEVAVTGTSKGKGFAGTMKRHNFHGGPATHGSKVHRIPGSSGAPTRNGRILKGKKMSGQLGNVSKTVTGVKVVGVDVEKNLLLLQGGIPGASNGLVYIYSKKEKIDTSKVKKAGKTEAIETKAASEGENK